MMTSPPQRIAIVGSSGSGKSTLAAALAERTLLPLVHLDQLFWLPGWIMRSEEEFRRLHEEAVAGDRWIIDGNYSRVMDSRLAAADLIVFLDLPTRVCLWSALRRRFSKESRVGGAEASRDRLTLEFLHWIASYRFRSRPGLIRRLNSLAATTAIEVLRSRREVARFLESF